MRTLTALTLRNMRLFFKDKGTLITSLITPLILLVLYVTFLGNVYRSSFISGVPEGFTIPESVISRFVGGQLVSSLLAVSCVSVAFCANLIMVQDKYLGTRSDLEISPARSSSIALSYYLATLINALLVCFTAGIVCMLYLALIGDVMPVSDMLSLALDIVLLVMFGTALSSLVCAPLKTEGQLSAVGTIISAGYGFICGAYMPISQFGDGLRAVISFLPGTYGTSLMRNHAMASAFREMEKTGLPAEFINGIRDAFDCNLYFFGTRVSVPVMYAVLAGSVAALIILYLLFNLSLKRRHA